MARRKTRIKKSSSGVRKPISKAFDSVKDAIIPRSGSGSISFKIDLPTEKSVQPQAVDRTPDSASHSVLPSTPSLKYDHEKSDVSIDEHARYLRRLLQYTDRLERREERLAAAQLRLKYERDVLKNEERWRGKDLATAVHEMEQVSRVAFEPTSGSAAQPSSEKLTTAMSRVMADEENVRRQEKLVAKHEGQVHSAEASLHRVMKSILATARKCLEHSAIQHPMSDDLISNSTQDSEARSTKNTSRTKLDIPPDVTKYFDKQSNQTIMFERVLELEYEREEVLQRRQFEQDRGETPDEQAMRSADASWAREYALAKKDYEKAQLEFETATRECEQEGHDPTNYYNTESDDEDMEEVEEPTITQNTLQKNTSDTFSNLNNMMRRFETLGPDPDDPTGLINTTLQSSLMVPLPGQDRTERPSNRIANWVSEIQPPHAYQDVLQASPEDDRDASINQNSQLVQGRQSPQIDDSPSHLATTSDNNRTVQPGAQSGLEASQPVAEKCMDDRMLQEDSQANAHSSAGDRAEEKPPEADSTPQPYGVVEEQRLSTDDATSFQTTLFDGKSETKHLPSNATSPAQPSDDDAKPTRLPHMRDIASQVIAAFKLKRILLKHKNR